MLLAGGGAKLREIVLQKLELAAVFREVASLEGGLRRVVVIGRRLHERRDLGRGQGGGRRRGAGWRSRGGWWLLRAEERVERFLERLRHHDPVLGREDHSLELRDTAGRRR